MIGKLLDQRYQVVQALGQGGFGHTYIAQDTRRPGNPTCVVKHLQPATSDPEFLQTARRLFNSEAETLEKLGNHDQIPRLLAYFEEDEEFYLVEEYIAGHSLSSELLPGQRWNEQQVIQLLSEVLSILEFVHANRVIHRDLKPDNLIRRAEDNKLVLVDFGAVKQVKMQTIVAHGPINNETVAIGTPGYMPSEQGQGRPRPSSDIYALGMIGIQALTGLSPTHLAEDPETGEIIWQPYAQASDLLAAIVNQMVRHYFKFRYQSATEALQALGSLTNSYTPKALAVAVNQMGRYYLNNGYQFAMKALRSLQQPSQTSIAPNNETAQTTPQSGTPTPQQANSTQNTITIAPTNPRSRTTSSPSSRGSISISPQKLRLFMGAGAVSVFLAIAGISAMRQPSPAPAPKIAENKITNTAPEKTPQPPTPQNNCVVVVSSSNLRSTNGRHRTGKTIPAGTKVTVTGREEDGWLEISSPEPGWIWKSRTRNTCAYN
jgi:serine/threonine protein kinase